MYMIRFKVKSQMRLFFDDFDQLTTMFLKLLLCDY